MSTRPARRVAIALLAVFFLSGGECSPRRDTNPGPQLPAPVVAWNSFTAPACPESSGLPPTGTATMNDNAQTLANLIATYRFDEVLPPDPINVGVAQWHAADMSTNNYVGFIGSDGEDANLRIVCSGGTPNTQVGIIALGYTTDPAAAMAALMADPNSSLMIEDTSLFFSSVSVGYSEGYWMVILQ